MKKTSRFSAYAALIAAMYATLCHAQNLLVPESASMAVQFRVAEALCVLAFFTPTAIHSLSMRLHRTPFSLPEKCTHQFLFPLHSL